MRMRIRAVISVWLISLLFTGCSLSPDRRLEYRKVETLPRMALPEGMKLVAEDDRFAVPDAEQRLYYEKKERFELPFPPQLGVLASEEPDQDVAAPGVEKTRIVLSRDGNNYPMIMIETVYPWAWEYVGQALPTTELKIDDRNRDIGVYFVRVPERFGADSREVQIKLSRVANGVQVTVLDRKGEALLAREPGKQILQHLYDAL